MQHVHEGEQQMANLAATQGVTFDDAKVLVVDNPELKQGDTVNVAGREKVYGPYMLAAAIDKTEAGATRYMAVRVSKAQAGKTIDKLTKAELIQLLVQLSADKTPAQ
jgi:hypothetical protein